MRSKKVLKKIKDLNREEKRDICVNSWDIWNSNKKFRPTLLPCALCPLFICGKCARMDELTDEELNREVEVEE